ncbi:retrovirus-related pol polyprotein from transposon TNT 1-94 [Tanacetum coccineum]
MRQRRWIELFSDYDCEIRYHPGKANVVADALSRKEIVKPKRVRAMNMILQSSIKDRTLAAQKEAVDEFAGLQKGLDEMIEQRSDETLYYLDRIWVPLKGEERTLIMDEAHKSKYSVHPGADKMYYDLRDRYWWPRMKKDIAEYGKDNGENIMKSINEGTFHMGMVSDVIAAGTEGAVQKGPVRARVLNDLSAEEKERYKADIRVTNILLQGNLNYTMNLNTSVKSKEKPITDTMLGFTNARSEQREAIINPGQAKPISATTNGLWHIDEKCPRPSDFKISDYFKDQDATKIIWMSNHEDNEMQNDVQHNYVVDSNAEYTSDSNIILYNQYLEDNEENGVQSNVSSIQNDALMSIINEMHEEGVQQGVQSRLANKPDMVVNDSLTSELARYKELVGEYEKRANSTVGHYKSKTEEVTILKKDFKQKEDKFLEEFLDIKRLKEKIEDRLYKQDQSVQTVHMLCKPKSFYDEKNKVAIGYKNPLYLTRAKQAQSALYNGHVLVTTNHTPTVVHDSEDTREIAEITRKRMMEKMKSPLCVENKVRIALFGAIDDPQTLPLLAIRSKT